MNETPNETRTHSCRFASLACKLLHHQRRPSFLVEISCFVKWINPFSLFHGNGHVIFPSNISSLFYSYFTVWQAQKVIDPGETAREAGGTGTYIIRLVSFLPTPIWTTLTHPYPLFSCLLPACTILSGCSF